MSRKKRFAPLETARLSLAELADGKAVPTSPVVAGLVAGAPLATMLLGALTEFGVHVGPNQSALLGIAVSSIVGYLTNRGRRRPMPRDGTPQRRSTD